MKTLITSALPYVNNIPHLGNLIGSTLSADVYARHCRLARGAINTLYVCGADEHGTATETKAREEGISEQELCDKYEKKHKEIYDWFDISFDIWGRTHTQTHEKIVQEIFLKLHKNGYIEEKTTNQLYDTKAQKFLADRLVEGTCPYCAYPDARGDQCDNCQKLIQAPELINPTSKLTGTKPQLKETTHLYLDLPKLKGKLSEWLQKVDDKWSDNEKKTTQHWLENIHERAISRDLKWGVPVPLEGYEDKVFYVWFDAPIGYVSITAHANKDWQDWWKNPKVRLVQFMGKDNIIFHSIIFPATQLGTGDEWTMVDELNTTEFLNLQEGKFSKSRKEGIFGDDCINIEEKHGITVDYWRYYLLATRPKTSDSTFSFEDFQSRINNELIANLANLVNRTVHFANKNIDHVEEPEKLTELGLAGIKDHEFPEDEDARKTYTAATKMRAEVIKHLEGGRIKQALQEILQIGKSANAFFQHRKPWEDLTDNREQMTRTIYVLVNILREIATLLEPFTPQTSQKIFAQIGAKKVELYEHLNKPLPGHALEQVQEPKPLFMKIDDELTQELKTDYGPQNHPLKLTVAKIKQATMHPNADKLYILKLDLGGREKQIVSGIKDYYNLEELEGKNIVIVDNLKPAKLRGEKSEGMLLAGEIKDDVGLLTAPDAQPGDVLMIGGKKASSQELEFTEFTKHKIKLQDGKLTVDDALVSGTEFVGEKGINGPLR